MLSQENLCEKDIRAFSAAFMVSMREAVEDADDPKREDNNDVILNTVSFALTTMTKRMYNWC